MARSLQMNGEAEQRGRESARQVIELKVEYKRLNAFLADYTRNISSGGTFIQTDKPLPVGTDLVFHLRVPTLEEPLRLAGQVRWFNEVGSDAVEGPGMGIRFVYQDDSERLEMKQVIEGLMVDSLGGLLAGKLLDRGRAVWQQQQQQQRESAASLGDGEEGEG